MNSLDPSLAKYLSTSQQEILDTYHGKKKKKSKNKAKDTAGFIVDDSMDIGWGGNAGSDDEDSMPVIQHRSTTGFKPVGAPAPTASTSANPEEAIPADEAPLVIGSVVQDAPTASSSGPAPPKRLQGGLQTASQLKEENARRRELQEAERVAAAARARQLKQEEEARGGSSSRTEAEETAYRDASGRKIDTKAYKAEQARIKRAEAEKEMAKMEWGKGLIQRDEKEKRKRELEELGAKSLNRYADDKDLNEMQKETMRWNDPAARFLTETSTKKGSKEKERPKYKGPIPMNRFNIPPGYRWDGVDRSNGFEKDLVQAGNKRRVQEAAHRSYNTEDM